MKNKNRRFGKKIRQFKKKGDTESRLSVNPFFLLCRNYRFFDSFGIPTSIPSVALLSVLEHLSRFSQKIDGRCHTETAVLQHVAVFQLSVSPCRSLCLRGEKATLASFVPPVALLPSLEHLSRFSQKIDGRCHTETTVLQHVAVFQLSVLSCLRSEKTPRISSFDCFYSSMQSPSLIFLRLLVSLLMALILRTTV